MILIGFVFGFCVWFFIRFIIAGAYTVNPNERAVKTSFGKAQRLKDKSTLDDPISEFLNEDEKLRYNYPQLKVIQPGLHFKMPWEKVHKVSIATKNINMAYDPENSHVNYDNTVLEAVTKDQLNIGLTGQIRYSVSEKNIYAYLFGVKTPIAHVMGYFVSVLRERIANFDAPRDKEDLLSPASQGISINDLRKNLRDINDHMDNECRVSVARYGVILEASLITGIEPPKQIESALAAINTAHNEVSSDISLAHAEADQKVVQSKRAVEIETLKAEGEIQSLNQLAEQLEILKKQGGKKALELYVKNVKLSLLNLTKRIIKEEKV